MTEAADSNSVLRLIGSIAVREIKARIRKNLITPSSGKAGGTTLYQRGQLSRSIKYRTEGDSVIISAGGQDVPYARIQHEGGIIKPKNAKYLAIPITAKARLSYARNYDGETFIANGMIFEKDEGGKIHPIYALKKQVIIPPRPYMELLPDDLTKIKTEVKAWILKQVKGKDS